MYANEMLTQPFSTDGLGGGTTNMNGDYSGTPQEFWVGGVAGYILHIREMHIFIDDTPGFTAGGYGSGSALTNGFSLRVLDADGAEQALLTPNLVKRNACWARYAHTDYIDFGSGSNFLTGHWHFFEEYGECLKLFPGWKLTTTLSDDLSFLIEHKLVVFGQKKRNRHAAG